MKKKLLLHDIVKLNKKTTLFLLLLTVINAFIPLIFALITEMVVDQIQSINNSILVYVLLCLFFLILYKQINPALLNFLVSKMKLKVKEIEIPKLNNLILNMDYIKFSDKSNNELIHRVIYEPGLDKIIEYYTYFLNAMSITLSIIIIIIKLMFNGLYMTLFFIPIAFINIKFMIKYGKEIYDVYRKNSNNSRICDYLEFDVLRGRKTAAERTIFDYSNVLNKKFEDLFMKNNKMLSNVRYKWWILRNALIVCSVLIIFIVLWVETKRYSAGEVEYGYIVSTIYLLFQMLSVSNKDLPNIAMSISVDDGYMKDIKSFNLLLNSENEIKKIKEKIIEIETIEFKDVWFKYPNTDDYALKGISLKFDTNLNYAIVGKNGSGKSTVIKLILGMYPIEKGELLINEKPIKDIDLKSLYQICGVAFQDFTKFDMTFKENIMLNKVNDDEFYKKLNLFGLDKVVNHLPDGIDSNLGKTLINSIDLSGGEWQRVALARTIRNDNKLLILDEPTAALDPIEESNLYEQYSVISKDIMTILISHRLGAVKTSDYIFVIEDGKIKEKGNHSTLLNQHGVYYKMYNLQKELYYEKK